MFHYELLFTEYPSKIWRSLKPILKLFQYEFSIKKVFCENFSIFH